MWASERKSAVREKAEGRVLPFTVGVLDLGARSLAETVAVSESRKSPIEWMFLNLTLEEFSWILFWSDRLNFGAK